MVSLDSKDEEAAFYKHDSDRAVGIIGAAIVENRLTDVLEAAMVRDKKIFSQLFSTGQPIGNFGTIIYLAYLLSLIGVDVYKELRLVNKIRNAFAHQVSVTNFDSQPVTQWMDPSKIIEVHKSLLAKKKAELTNASSRTDKTAAFILEQELSDFRNQYHLIIRFLIHTLESVKKTVQPKSPDSDTAP